MSEPRKKRSVRFRSAVTGRFVSQDHAERNPETTVAETLKPNKPAK